MTTKELIEELNQHDPDHEVIVLWHGYMRDVIAVADTDDGKIQLMDKPRTGS